MMLYVFWKTILNKLYYDPNAKHTALKGMYKYNLYLSFATNNLIESGQKDQKKDSLA